MMTWSVAYLFGRCRLTLKELASQCSLITSQPLLQLLVVSVLSSLGLWLSVKVFYIVTLILSLLVILRAYHWARKWESGNSKKNAMKFSSQAKSFTPRTITEVLRRNRQRERKRNGKNGKRRPKEYV